MVAATGDEVVAWCEVGFTDTLGRCRRTWWGRWVHNKIYPSSWVHQAKDQLPPEPIQKSTPIFVVSVHIVRNKFTIMRHSDTIFLNFYLFLLF